MSIRRITASLASVAGVLLAGTLLSPPVAAADLDGCAVGSTVAFYEGETVTFTDTLTCEVDSLNPIAGRVVDTFIPSPRGYSFLNTWGITGDTIGTVDFLVSGGPATVTVTLISLGPAPTPAAGTTTPIPDWVQAYGVFSSVAACLDGWSNSWQSWAEPITGGWVCTRMVPSLG